MPITLEDRQLRQKLRRNLKLDTRTAILGDNNNPSRVRVPGRSSYVYVRYPASDNNTSSLGWPTIVKMVVNISESPGTPVTVGYDDEGDYAVLGVSSKGLETNGEPGGGATINNPVNDWIDLELSPFLRSAPMGSGAPLFLSVLPFAYMDVDRVYHEFGGVEDGVDVSGEIPGSTNQWCLVGLFLIQATDTVEVIASTPKDLAEPLGIVDIQECIDGSTALSIVIDFWILRNGQTSIADTDKFRGGRQWINVPQAAAASGGAGDYILIRDEKSQNTAGGTFTASAWQTRTLNTEVSDAGGHASISSNQITLAAGTYRVNARCPARLVDQHQARLYNISDSAVVLLGTSEYSPSAVDTPNNCSIVMGRFTIAGSKTFELQHRCTTTRSSDGFGAASNLDTEIYSIIELIKE